MLYQSIAYVRRRFNPNRECIFPIWLKFFSPATSSQHRLLPSFRRDPSGLSDNSHALQQA